MPTILAIETSAELASAALLHGHELLVRSAEPGKNHSDIILPMVQALLQQAGIRLAQCDALAFGSGPGSFTGVRTAAGTVQGLAFGAARPVVPVVTLEAMAQACRETTGADDVLAILDARMGEVYWAQYRYQRDSWQSIVSPMLSRPAEVRPVGAVVACGNGLRAYADAFGAQPFASGGLPDMMPHAAQIAQLARAAYTRGEFVAADQAQPLYLRNKIALTTDERMAKAAGGAA